MAKIKVQCIPAVKIPVCGTNCKNLLLYHRQVSKYVLVRFFASGIVVKGHVVQPGNAQKGQFMFVVKPFLYLELEIRERG
ncbi:hypothetical protein SDC9_81142 [bioreactor metagenome]|uniref:Uncharacterized protein n=1 Tax=bioreactor metagenome TaxID=1076179 RepID=A0A644Z145_9ZZZZ